MDNVNSAKSEVTPSKARCVMVLGTASGVGKSWLTTALCRWYARQGLSVTPFKAQNMSNNARVVDGGEIGSAQYFQALAANKNPLVLMNPLLLKPDRDTSSQVILLGKVDDVLNKMPWRERSNKVWPYIAQSLDNLCAHHDVVVIEGAGSPAEINLHDSDVVNMRVALHAKANCLLVADIDKGGAFASLYGTWALLPKIEQERIKGFVLNKFRGDASLLAPAPAMLENLTGIPTIATLPMWREHGLPEEDGMFSTNALCGKKLADTQVDGLVVAIISYPRISNLDEFHWLMKMTDVQVVWVRSYLEWVECDWLILPGSKHTSSDLAWLKKEGLDQKILQHAAQNKAVLGICGGLQMLGNTLLDPYGVDGAAEGLCLLPVVTEFGKNKTVQKKTVQFGVLKGHWAALSHQVINGYEIHHGRTWCLATESESNEKASSAFLPEGLVWQNAAGNILGLYLHGIFEDPLVLKTLFRFDVGSLDSVFDGLADYIDQYIGATHLLGLLDQKI